MKVNQEIRTRLGHVPKEAKSVQAGNTKFSEFVTRQDQKLRAEQLNKLLADINVAGDRLGRTQTFQDLTKYKNLVKRFVKETVDFGMQLKQSHTWNQFGEGRKLNIVETIDKKLVELTDEVMQQEKQPIDLLGKIGEIKGLLINLYT